MEWREAAWWSQNKPILLLKSCKLKDLLSCEYILFVYFLKHIFTVTVKQNKCYQIFKQYRQMLVWVSKSGEDKGIMVTLVIQVDGKYCNKMNNDDCFLNLINWHRYLNNGTCVASWGSDCNSRSYKRVLIALPIENGRHKSKGTGLKITILNLIWDI